MGLVGTHPAVRGRGHATRLSEHLVAWSYAKGCRTVALDASRLGRPIYERLGFRPVGSTVQLAPTRMQAARNPEVTVSPLTSADQEQVLGLDAGVFGGDRRRPSHRPCRRRKPGSRSGSASRLRQWTPRRNEPCWCPTKAPTWSFCSRSDSSSNNASRICAMVS
jgi:hypothetical protein